MAHLRCDFRSDILDMNTSMTVVLPEKCNLHDVCVVYLLHGLADNCSGWTRYTSVERYARKYNVALVIPEVQRSFYTDMALGLKYFEFVHDELPKICMQFFNFSNSREKNFLMGLSMGGYGSLKCSLHTPERYCGIGLFSPVADIKKVIEGRKDGSDSEFKAIFGSKLEKGNDFHALVESLSADIFPRYYVACGEEDIRFFHSELIVDSLKKKGIDIFFEHWKGDHNWDFWDDAVRRCFDYFFKEDR